MSILKLRLYTSIKEAQKNPKRVQRLQLFHHKVHRFPNNESLCPRNLAQFKNLEELHIGWCSDAQFPDEIQTLKRLKALFCLNTPIQALPDWLFSCTSLRRLIVRGTDIRAIPDYIERLSDLRMIDFGNNSLPAAPAVLGSLHNLKSLRLPDNCLTDLPVEISRLSRLSSLGLVNNAFSKPEADKIRSWFRPGVVVM